MNVYDFDNTIYNGESSIDFFLYVLSKNKTLFKYLPLTGYSLLLYKAGLLSINKIQDIANRYTDIVIKYQDDINDLINGFWEKYSYKLKTVFLNRIESNDIIITASPRILIDGIKNRINTNNIICSEINMKTGKLEYLCMGENKVKALYERYPDIEINEFYTDSIKNDIHLINIANKPYLVKGNHVVPILKKEPNKHHR